MAVPLVFLRPAKDLLSALKLNPDAHILDVGAGAGVTAKAIKSITGFRGSLVELDISMEMLKASASGRGISKVAGKIPGLPFRNESFDAVMSNFVMSHVKEYQLALADMVRVLKSGGRIGITAWGNEKHEYSDMWNETAESMVSKKSIERVVEDFMPSREIFTNPKITRDLLIKAGAKEIEINKSESTVTTSISDYIEMKSVMLQGRFIKATLGASGFNEFRGRLIENFTRQFNDPITYPSIAHIVVGSKP